MTPLFEVRCGACRTVQILDADGPTAALEACTECGSCTRFRFLEGDADAGLFETCRRLFGTHNLVRTDRGYRAVVADGWSIPRDAAAEVSRLGWFALTRRAFGRRVLQLSAAKGLKRNEHAWGWPLLLLVVSLPGLFVTGYEFAISLAEFARGAAGSATGMAVAYVAAVLFIVLSHEFGHYVAGRRSGIRVTLPYLIPVPLLFGTMGAMIQQRSPAPDRDALIRMGAAGPLAGLAATIVVLAIGIPLSIAVPATTLHGEFIHFGEPLLLRWMGAWLGPAVGPGQEVMEHPLALAGWFGLFLTALNLIPGGQLDGGHVLRGYLPDRLHRRVTYALALGLAALGTRYVGWYLWAVVLFILGRLGDPGATDEERPVSAAAHAMAIGCAIAMVLCFVPDPITFDVFGGQR